jgi:hypothetical protein
VKFEILLLIFVFVAAAILLVKHLRPSSPRGYTRRSDRAPPQQDTTLGFAPLSTDIDHHGDAAHGVPHSGDSNGH